MLNFHERGGEMKHLIAIMLSVLGLSVVALMIIGSVGPAAYVISGKELPNKYVTTLNELELLSDFENVQLFYSDAFIDIKNGMYFVTENNLILYSKDWNEEKIILSLSDIVEVSLNSDGSYFKDSIIWITTKNGDEIRFPILNQHGGDKIFFNYINKHSVQKVPGA